MPTARRPLLPWIVWGTAAALYAVAIINRSSLAALGPAAQDHFGIDATTLATFPMIQLFVYAALQIPVGVLIDRVGATAMLLGGSVLMVVGQTVMATVFDVRLAILARVLVGAGDACTFISVMRLLPEWFAVRQLPVVSQLTGLIGQAGQLVSVAPLALFVSLAGWTNGFLGLAAIGLLVTILGALVIRDRPGVGTFAERMIGRTGKITRNARSLGGFQPTGTVEIAPPSTEMIPVMGAPRPRALRFWSQARRLLRLPGVRLAYWVHFTSPFAANVFLLLWGTPFLVGGIGLDPAAAGGLLSLTVLSSMFAGLVLGPVSSRFIERRVWVNLGIVIAIVLTWCAVIFWPGTPPTWLLIALLVVMPLGGPASMIAFEVLRSHTPRSFTGFATGLVNTAGFTASLLVILLIGLVLDMQGAGSPELYSLDAFRVAFAVQIPFWVLGIVMILIEQRRTGRWMREHGRRLR
ncbi:MFS transporter [Leucobacter luti]|uniref:Lysosomal dipeptide transporter MFSD1 n=1 Tax=Leucobacter luti TaxID=340320 RepID=A0A4Q7U4U6_9MICO|nr:MFS transporter [Leucobacter luti]MBL3700492.1 MFS transporter [Leucobacter luti]RZT68674.1 sugar phosphate permease [Leucobacter luti]